MATTKTTSKPKSRPMPKGAVAVSMWKCPTCHSTCELSFLEMEHIGTPICQTKGCDNFDEPLTLVGEALVPDPIGQRSPVRIPF